MKTSYIKVAALLALLSTASSCEEMIEVTPQSAITGQVYFQNESDYANYLTGIYAQYRGLVNNDTFGEYRSESLVQGINARFNSSWSQTMTPNNDGAVNYQGWYSIIGNCNLLLKRIEGQVFGNEAAKRQIQAETLALRAYTYLHLSRIIGDTPIVLDAVEDQNVPAVARTAAPDVYKQIYADLDKAIGLFPTAGYEAGKYRINKPAAYAIKAEAKLWNAKVNGVTADLADAVTAVQEVEKSGVSLVANFRDITTKRNNEIILAAYFDRNETGGGGQYARNALVILNNSAAASNVADLATASSVDNAQSAYQISPLSRTLFEANPTDKRIPSTYIWEVQGGKQTFAWIQKYRGTRYAEDRAADDDVIVYRLGDLYLIAAEALAAQNKGTEALTYLNKVRQRAGIPDFTVTDKAKLEREIVDERGRELYFENKRWYDLVRAHKAGTINVYEYVPNLRGKTTPLYWPLAQNVLANNKLLVQTQGY